MKYGKESQKVIENMKDIAMLVGVLSIFGKALGGYALAAAETDFLLISRIQFNMGLLASRNPEFINALSKSTMLFTYGATVGRVANDIAQSCYKPLRPLEPISHYYRAIPPSTEGDESKCTCDSFISDINKIKEFPECKVKIAKAVTDSFTQTLKGVSVLKNLADAGAKAGYIEDLDQKIYEYYIDKFSDKYDEIIEILTEKNTRQIEKWTNSCNLKL